MKRKRKWRKVIKKKEINKQKRGDCRENFQNKIELK